MGLLSFFRKRNSMPSSDIPLKNTLAGQAHPLSGHAKTIEELHALVNGRGHRDFFCLNNDYSPGSRIPAIDFSLWIKDKIKNRDSESLKILLWELVRGNPGIGTTIRNGDNAPNYLTSNWHANIEMILNADISHYVAADPEVLDEIKTFMIFSAIHSGLDGFVLTTAFPSLLSTILLPWNINFTNLEILEEKANRFIRKMRRETDYWKDIPLFKRSTFINWDDKNEVDSCFLTSLASLPFASRLHFFDICVYTECGTKLSGKPIAEMTFYATRQLGIDSDESAQLLMQSGLIQEYKDPVAYLSGKTKDEIASILSDAGLPFKLGWKKDKLIELVMKERGDEIRKIADNIYLGKLNFDYFGPARRTQTYINQRIDACKLILGFAT